METPKRRMPFFIIGVIALFAISVIGIIVDFVADIGGAVAIISVLAGFLVFAVFIIIDVIVRRAAEKKALSASPDAPSQYNVPADQRFLRHSDAADGQTDGYDPVSDYSAYGGYSPFDDSFDDGFDDGFDNTASDLERIERESPSMVLRRRAAALRAQQEGNAEPADDPFGSFEQPQAPTFAPHSTFAPAAEDDAQPDFAPQPQQAYDAEPDRMAEDEYYDDGAAEDFVSEAAAQPQQDDYLQPEVSFAPQPAPAAPVFAPQPAPAAESAPAAPVQAAYAAYRTSGQTLDSFYEDMSDEDILYRDCVEVWAADAKPSVLRLMKLVEELEDKKAQIRFGRELEYVNAMIDRIYCFTQLEYVDELLELEEHNFATLVKECLKRFSPFFMEKKLGLLWKGLDVNVMTDKKWFIFALTQVIFNSVEFTPEGGKIAISAKKNGEYIDLMIDDSGKGVSPDELPCVFIAGYMGDESPNESGRRTGMGLFIAQSVLRKMGGDAFIESNYGKGARVTLRVPAIMPPAK